MSETALLSMPFAGAVPMTASRVLGLSWYSAPGIIQKGIKIIAPSPYKIKQEMQKIDPHTQNDVVKIG